ncbi:MAG: hypothetical protein OCC46_02420 [Pseudodesulfovibrio sp.]
MEIGSMGGMQQASQMNGMRRPHGPPPDAEELSSKIMEEQDADGDGLLSNGEFDSDLLAALDENQDGTLSQAELQAGLQTKLDEGKAAFDSGEMPSTENMEFMQKMHAMAGDNPQGGNSQGGSRSKASEAYSLMQESMFGASSSSGSSYNTDQLLLDNLNLTV